MKTVRLDKFLSDAGLGTRSQVKTFLKKGAVSVNGTVVLKPETKICPETDAVICRGVPVTHTEFFYYMLNKPAGFVSATEDKSAATVLSLLKDAPGRGLFPVGRLDKDTEGLLLITNDGALAHRLLSPRHHVEKTYYVRAAGSVTAADLEKLESGVEIGEKALTLPAKAKLLSVIPSPEGSAVSEVELSICEGKYHQVKRMFHAIGAPVLFLKRHSMGSLSLDENLAPGAFRPLTPEEIAALKKE